MRHRKDAAAPPSYPSFSPALVSTLIHVWGWERGRQGGDTREGGANRGEGPLAYSLLVCVNITSWAVWAQCTPSISVSILFSNMCNFRSGTELATKKSIYFNVTLHKIQTALFCSLTHTHTHTRVLVYAVDNPHLMSHCGRCMSWPQALSGPTSITYVYSRYIR